MKQVYTLNCRQRPSSRTLYILNCSIGHCRADKDVEDAERTAKLLNIPFVEVNFVKEYWTDVFELVIN